MAREIENEIRSFVDKKIIHLGLHHFFANISRVYVERLKNINKKHILGVKKHTICEHDLIFDTWNGASIALCIISIDIFIRVLRQLFLSSMDHL